MNRNLIVALLICAACTGKYVRPATDEKVEVSAERIERGKYLVDSVAVCGSCHSTWNNNDSLAGESPTGYLAGGNVISVAAEGFEVWVPNLTPDRETGLGDWSDDQIIRATRDGVHADGRLLLPFMPFPSYQHLSDEDVRAVVVYLRSVPAVKQLRARSENKAPFPIGFLLRRGVSHHLPVVSVAAPPAGDKIQVGKYLAAAAHCAGCHALGTQGERPDTDPLYMAGSVPPMDRGWGKVWASNLTPDPDTGIGQFSADQLRDAFTTPRRLDGALMGPPMADLSKRYATMKREDLDAIVAWLQSLKPAKNAVPDRQLNELGRQALDAK